MLDYDKKFLLKSADNLTFDGSSIRGFSEIAESDLKLMLDWPAFYWLPADVFGSGKVIVFGEVHAQDGSPYKSDFRSRLRLFTEQLTRDERMMLHVAPEIEGFLFKDTDAERSYHETGKFEFISTGGYYHSLPQDPLRQFIDRSSLQVPVIGPILQKAAVARFARTLATMFGAGVPLVEAMKSVAGATGNIVYQDATLKIRDEISTGMRLQRAMENTGLFPNMVVQMIAVGEESGSLDEMAAKVADFYEADVDAAVDGLSSLLEPLIMVILGVLVGGLVIAMYLPIFKLGAVV
jgi:hypothetical protein